MVKKKWTSQWRKEKKGEVPAIFQLPFEEQSETPAVFGDVDLIPAGSFHREEKKKQIHLFRIFFF